MDNIQKILRFHWMGKEVDVRVDPEKCSLLDIVLDYEDEVKKQGIRMDYAYPCFSYVWKMNHSKLETDKHLMLMFERNVHKEQIDIWLGTSLKPDPLYKLVLNFRRRSEMSNAGINEVHENVSLDQLEDTILNNLESQKNTSRKGKQPLKKQPKKKSKTTTLQPPPPISPQTAFKALIVRKSPRFSPPQISSQIDTSYSIPSSLPDQTLFNKKLPTTTARRNGLYKKKSAGNGEENMMSEASGEVNLRESTGGGRTVKRKVDFGEDDVSEDGEDRDSEYGGDDDCEEVRSIPKVKENWKGKKWKDFLDDEDDDNYYMKLYRNGDMFGVPEIGKIVLRPWMIFMDKQHLKDVLKDYCIQEGFAITILLADNNRYTCTCSAAICNWRLHASKLADGITWAIKKIEPDKHKCRGLETYNPICNVKWAGNKLMEDIRANPDIPGKALNELLFSRYGVYMKKSSLYGMKKYVIYKLFGGHDESYAELPTYVKVICETNPDSKAYCSGVESDTIPRELLFSRIFISFVAMWKGFLGGCRPLIGIDGTHLKGNYGGILLSAVTLDGNNEIFPLAYAVVSVEDKESWGYFLWNLYNIVKESSRKDWTIISDRQKGIDLALADVWPTAKRRYCCRHLSRNYKKQFAGPLMYVLFWRVCNATSQFTYRKAMERLHKEGGDRVMAWFAQLGDPATWSKHKFDPNVCNDSNTSNFVESFNSTLGIDRCRPVLTLLEGIRRVCMVRIATRHETTLNWKDDDLCPKIGKIVTKISKDIISCKAYMSKPGEYEIHEGKSQFPLSLNNKVCSCGAWQISGIPCRHAIRAMLHAKIDPQKIVSSWYHVRTYKQVYSFSINPVPDKDQWPTYENIPNLKPPTIKRGVGRPSRNRWREEGENQKEKRSKTVKCTKCLCFGHNARTCKGGLTAKEKKDLQASGLPPVVRNPRVRTKTKAASKTATSAATGSSQSSINMSQFPDSQSQQA